MPDGFRHRIRVRWAECDQQGVVFYPNYLAYFDIAITELLRETMGSYGELVRQGTDMVVGEARVRYLASARFDDELDLLVSVSRLGETSMSTALELERVADGATLVEGELRHVFVDPLTLQKKQMPPALRHAVSRYQAAAVT
jgi:acyl-CoA thioester hydrolase